jgi:ubiquinone/menaquinone biosynthesis C-methylase UbiE
MDKRTERKWDRAAARFDVMTGRGPENRWAPAKRALYAHMGEGKIVFVAIGTGLDIQHFPPGRNILALDISARMLDKARPRASSYRGNIELRQLDLHDLDLADESVDQVFTSCTFCSVPGPVEALRKVRAALRRGGDLYMFEHTGSRFFPFNLMLDLATPFARRVGPDLNRATVQNVERAGFEILEVRNYFLDVVKTIHAIRGREETSLRP